MTTMPGVRRREGRTSRRPEQFSPDMQVKRDEFAALAAEPYRGITTGAAVVPDLFPLRSTGIDLSSIRNAALEYLAALAPAEAAASRFPMGDETWRHWANPAQYFLRHGQLLEDLDEAQRHKALKVVRCTLSEPGYQHVVDSMHLGRTIGEIVGDLDNFNEWLFWLSIYGSPEGDGPWGWQLDGHHLNINCVIVGDQLVLTPSFAGAEPVFAAAGKYSGTRVLAAEESQGLVLFRSLRPGQRNVARIADELPPELFAGAFRDNLELSYHGIALPELDEDQRAAALDLIGVYVNRVRHDYAPLRMEEVRRHADDTHFAWAGGSGPDSVFYYRVHSPVILIEFDHQRGVLLDNDKPERIHIHTVVRTPNGNDYGADLLRQHHERFHS
ncbi:MAG TPA: DUF3500 domain-containing protein [Mycobacteriales bacterium]